MGNGHMGVGHMGVGHPLAGRILPRLRDPKLEIRRLSHDLEARPL